MASDQIEVCGCCKNYAKCKALMHTKKFKRCLNDIKMKHR